MTLFSNFGAFGDFVTLHASAVN